MSSTIRLDKWLWHARFFKTRTLAAKTVSSGGVRVNTARVDKPATSIKPGDGLSFAQADTLRIIRVLAIGTRRGPAPEAQALYEDLTPEPVPLPPRVGARPTKKDRRDLDAFHQSLPQSVLEFGNDDD